MAGVRAVRGSGATVSKSRATDEAQAAPGLRLNRRMKAILSTGLLPSMSPSALTVLAYAGAYGDFSTCNVFLGGKTVAKNTRGHRGSVRGGIAELLDVGFLVIVKAATHRRAAVYRLALVKARIEAAQARVAAVGAKRRKTPEQRAEESAKKKAAARQGAHGSAPRGLMGEPPGGSSVSPEGAHGSAPNHSLNVPSSLKERYPSGRSSRRSGEQGDGGRIAGAAVKRQGA